MLKCVFEAVNKCPYRSTSELVSRACSAAGMLLLTDILRTVDDEELRDALSGFPALLRDAKTMVPTLRQLAADAGMIAERLAKLN